MENSIFTFLYVAWAEGKSADVGLDGCQFVEVWVKSPSLDEARLDSNLHLYELGLKPLLTMAEIQPEYIQPDPTRIKNQNALRHVQDEGFFVDAIRMPPHSAQTARNLTQQFMQTLQAS